MTRQERAWRLAEMYQLIGSELDHHIGNGSEFLYQEADGSEAPAGVVAMRFRTLKRVRDDMFRKAAKLVP